MDINIKNKKKKDNSWIFQVDVGGDDFEVEIDKSYWQDLTDGDISPEDLIKKSFEFLLEREPKSSILNNFNIKIINKYFPEYEDKII